MEPRLPRFEYCALEYLNMWLSAESRWCEVMAGTNENKKLGAMSEFAAEYRISRNLRRKYDVERNIPRFKPVLDIIDTLTPCDFPELTLLPALERVSKEISLNYGGVQVLSLTTKFLWLKIKSPIIIYDRQARVALQAKDGDISDYYAKWRERFASYSAAIESVCNSLLEVRDYSVDSKAVTPQFIAEVASQQWFHERVFDIYLWTVGGRSVP